MKKILLVVALTCVSINASAGCNKVGTYVYCDDGKTYNRIGDTVHDNMGNSWRKQGDYTYGSDGTTYNTIDSTTYDNKGNSWNDVGGYTYGSDGTNCVRTANSVNCY